MFARASTETLPKVVVYDAPSEAWRHFARPLEIVATERLGDVMDCLRRVENLVESRGLYAVGFVSYEAAPAFDRALVVREEASFPLVWFGLFPNAETVPPPEFCRTVVTRSISEAGSDDLGSCFVSWQPSVTAEEYAATIGRLREAIAAGETYQVNYTFRLRRPAGDPWTLFAELVEAQQPRYAAYIETDRFAVCSASPELFFELHGNRIVARPMKGTTARGRWPEEDLARAAALAASEKERAENAMIVDMMRNDLGRIARVGSVRVSDLFRVERYPTLWQMTSCVTADTRASLAEIFAVAFPCASVTGAPKASTMRIIAQHETAPRRVYTGSIGLISPGRRARFNVAIRTVLVDRHRQECEYGVGGGVVWDSTPEGEYSECLLKAQILTARQPEFSLLESMLWRPYRSPTGQPPAGQRGMAQTPLACATGFDVDGGYWLLDEHLHRLQQSAEYFGFPLMLDAVVAALDDLAARLQGACSAGFSPNSAEIPAEAGTTSALEHVPAQLHKVRLLVDRNGIITTEATTLDEAYLREPVRLVLAAHAVDAADLFLYHKTTHRAVYDAARAGCIEGDDVLLYNRRGEVTETCRANIAVRCGDELLTPPVTCGLLAGTYRARLLAEGKLRERTIPLKKLETCDELFSLNSVRGLQRACLVGRRSLADFV